MIKTTMACAATLMGLAAVGEAQPRLSNGELRPAAVQGALNGTMLQGVTDRSATAWVGYEVPVIQGEHRMCCSSGMKAGCCGDAASSPGRPRPSTPPGGAAVARCRLKLVK